jgi:tRNA-dependent cyclodipeptide synthase
MELYRIRGGSKEALEAQEYNLCAGISLGNKWFTPENILGHIEWALRYTKDYVVICPADDIHAINIQVRNRRSYASALSRARKISSDLMSSVRKLVSSRLSEEQINKLVYATWSDVANDNYKRKVNWLYTYTEEDPEFKSRIQNIVRQYTKNENRLFSDEDISLLSTYVIEELPELIERQSIKGYTYDADLYPFDGELNMLVEQIQQGKKFPDIRRHIMGTEPKVLLIVR